MLFVYNVLCFFLPGKKRWGGGQKERERETLPSGPSSLFCASFYYSGEILGGRNDVAIALLPRYPSYLPRSLSEGALCSAGGVEWKKKKKRKGLSVIFQMSSVAMEDTPPPIPRKGGRGSGRRGQEARQCLGGLRGMKC